jgi:glycosyltransferase involved in cell wall biosynthesis
VARNFALRSIPCLDLFNRLPLGPAFAIQTVTYLVMLLAGLISQRADVYYSRDVLTLLLVSLWKPRRALVYEAHHLAKSGMGHWLQSVCVRRAGLTVALTGKLADDLKARGARQVLVAHDGIRMERFANAPDRQTARARLNLPAEIFIAGYVGQLHTMSMGKGLDILIDAIAQVDRPVALGLAGGPERLAETLRACWLDRGLPPDRFLYLGQVAPPLVPVVLAAFDVCTMPFPWTEHFAYYASPLKLFEYLASGGVILSSDLPSVAEVVRDGESALLVPPGSVEALAAALRRLYDDPALRAALGEAARQIAPRYSWQVRAERILDTIRA